jgi:hypothetical protein
VTAIFWQLGLAHRVWPAHPLLATSLIASAACLVLDVMLRPSTNRQA